MLEFMGALFCLFLAWGATLGVIEIVYFFKNLSDSQKDCLQRIKVLEGKE